MKPDGMLVEGAMITEAMQSIHKQGAEDTLSRLSEQEQVLGKYIAHATAAVAGKLALSGAPMEIVQASHEEIITIILTCVGALARGHYALWKEMATGTMLAQFDDSLADVNTLNN